MADSNRWAGHARDESSAVERQAQRWPCKREAECMGSPGGLHPFLTLTNFDSGPRRGMADAADSKSAEGNLVRVRLSPRACISATTQPTLHSTQRASRPRLS